MVAPSEEEAIDSCPHKLIYRGFLAVTFQELESIMTPFGR